MYKWAFIFSTFIPTLYQNNIYRDIIIDIGMDSDYEEDLYDDGTDSGNDSPDGAESEGDADFVMDPGFEDEPSGSSGQKIEEEYYFEVKREPYFTF